MTSSAKPAFIFIHGAWHGPSTWDGVRASLEVQGFETHAHDSITTGIRDPIPQSHLDDVLELQKKIASLVNESHKDVILVAHSFGGLISGGAVEGFEKKLDERKYGVIGCIFVASFLVPSGQSLATFSGGWRERTGKGISPDETNFSTDNPKYYKNSNPHYRFYSDISAETAQPLIDSLRWQALPPVLSPAVSESWQFVPCFAVYCLEDNAIHIDFQREMVHKASEVAKFPIKTYEIKSSHSPWLCHLSELVEHIVDASNVIMLSQYRT